MRIDEFVNTYTAIELDKINERKSERSKPGRKALMGRVGVEMYLAGEIVLGIKGMEELGFE